MSIISINFSKVFNMQTNESKEAVYQSTHIITHNSLVTLSIYNYWPLVKQQMMITAVMAMASKIPTTTAAISAVVSFSDDSTVTTVAKKIIKTSACYIKGVKDVPSN